MKGAPTTLNWNSATQFDSISLNPTPRAITACPIAETTGAAGAANFTVCPNSDYATSSTRIVGNVANVQACAQQCVNTQGCTRAVYDKVASICHSKSNTDNSGWSVAAVAHLLTAPRVSNGIFDSIRVAPVVPAPITACPTAETTASSNGKTFSICPSSDFQVPSYQITPNVASTSACAQLCTADAQCQRAVYDNIYSYCHLKASAGTSSWCAPSCPRRSDTLSGTRTLNSPSSARSRRS